MDTFRDLKLIEVRAHTVAGINNSICPWFIILLIFSVEYLKKICVQAVTMLFKIPQIFFVLF